MMDWSCLSPERQLQLREEYGRDPACQSGICSLDAKIAQFSEWLAERGIVFKADDVKRRS